VWIGDAGRDMLAGHLIVFRNMDSKYGPWNTGINSTYPPIYYYFIALLTLIAKGNHNYLAGLIILYQSTGIILVFLIIKKELSNLPALAISLLYSLASGFIYFSMLQISVSNSVIIALASLFFFQLAFKKNKIINLIISAVLLSLASSFWYGAMFIWPIYLLIFLLNFDLKNLKLDNFLELLIFGLSAIFSFLIFFSPIIEIVTLNNMLQQLFGNGTSQLSLSNFKIDNFLKSIDLTINILHPELTFVMYLIYGLIIIKGLVSKKPHLKKFIIISLFALLFHYIFYNIHNDPLGHYLNNVYFFLAALLAYGLKIALEKSKLSFLLLFLIILISSKSFEQERLDSDLSYQHSLQVSKLIHQHFPDSSIIDGGESCRNTMDQFYWESKKYWYFQKEKPYFLFDDFNSQVTLKNNNTVLLCWHDSNYNYTDKTYLSREGTLLKFQLQNIEYRVFKN
jgi:asparagine N-glycosylation enzyme membrane subunit Stt3